MELRNRSACVSGNVCVYACVRVRLGYERASDLLPWFQTIARHGARVTELIDLLVMTFHVVGANFALS